MTFKVSPSVSEVWLVPFYSVLFILGLNVISSDSTSINVNLPSSIRKGGPCCCAIRWHSY
jgi:hypothetical protein